MTTNISAIGLDAGTDELVRLALEECVKRQRFDNRVSVLIYPDHRCILATKFARLGAQVVIADDIAVKNEVTGRILAAGLSDEISFAPLTLEGLPETIAGEPFDIIILRRGLGCLTYARARQVIRHLLLKLRIGGKMYISVLGLHSELSQGYADTEVPVEQRYAELAPALAAKYDIHKPVCLYTERNLFMLLLEAGASVLRTLTSTYGNVKGVAVRV